MQPNLILVDVGNTTMKIGVSLAGELASYSLQSDARQTSDSLGLNLLALLRHAGAEGASFEACLICSVVPSLDTILREAVGRYVGCPVLFTPADMPVPLENRYLCAEQVGADRLLAAWAARMLRPGASSLIVIDFGTAVTFDCVQDSAYLGGLIFPGPQTALNALAGATAKLPGVSLDCDADGPAPGRDTATSIRHGIYFGFASMVDGLVARLRATLSEPCAVIATGGFARPLQRATASLQEVHGDLLLRGLQLLYQQRQTGCRN